MPPDTITAKTGRPGSQSALRSHNRERVIGTLQTQGTLTQAQLMRRTGLSAATVSNIVRDLLDDGVVSVEERTVRGRRARAITLTDRETLAVGLDFGRSHVRALIGTLGHTVVAERIHRIEPGTPSEQSIAIAVDMVDDMIAAENIDRSHIVGVGAAIPGPIDQRSGRVVDGFILPEWLGVNPAERLEAAFGIPAVAENDATLGALAHTTWGDYRGERDLVFVKLASGIGAGIVSNGEIVTGRFGATGEIGHCTFGIDASTDVCRCGNRGCLEAVASIPAIIEQLSRGLDPARDLPGLIERAKRGDPATVRVIEDAAAALGRALAVVGNLLGPAVIVVGGPLGELGCTLLDPVRASFARGARPYIADSTELVTNEATGESDIALGAIEIALRGRGGAVPLPQTHRQIPAQLQAASNE